MRNQLVRSPVVPALASALLVAACIVPPSVYERASLSPPPQQQGWADLGRYRQAGNEPASMRAPTNTPTSAPTSVAAQQAAPPREYKTSVDELAEARENAPTVAPTPEPPLYAWDDGVVDGAPQGRVAEQSGTPRGLETPPAGRAHIIELYQQVLDERDALTTEVEGLRKDLEQTRAALETKTKEAQDLTAQVAALEAARAGLTSDNQDLAARLVQAQIRRLEAEKLLLETRIEVEKAKAEEAALAAAQARGGAAKSKAPPKEPPKGEEKPE